MSDHEGKGYLCAGCKTWFVGEPAEVNGKYHNQFCAHCKDDRVRKAKEGRRQKRESNQMSPRCIWCGLPITESDPAVSKNMDYNSNVHDRCAKIRDSWLTPAIKAMPKVGRFVARREAELGPDRDARIDAEKKRNQTRELTQQRARSGDDGEIGTLRQEVGELKAMLKEALSAQGGL